MVIEVKSGGVYIPRYNGNRELPEDEQIKIHHRFLFPEERKKYVYTKPVQIDQGSGKVDSKVDFIQDEKGIAKAIITKIENLKISVDGKEKEIKTVQELYANVIPNGLIVDIETGMLLASPEVDKDFLG